MKRQAVWGGPETAVESYVEKGLIVHVDRQARGIVRPVVFTFLETWTAWQSGFVAHLERLARACKAW